MEYKPVVTGLAADPILKRQLIPRLHIQIQIHIRAGAGNALVAGLRIAGASRDIPRISIGLYNAKVQIAAIDVQGFIERACRRLFAAGAAVFNKLV